MPSVMPDLLDGLCQYLAGQQLGTYAPGTLDGDLYTDQLPEGLDNTVAVAGYGGEQVTYRNYSAPNVQVRVRGTTAGPNRSRARAWALYRALHGLTNVQLPDGTLLLTCFGIQSSPQYMGQDDTGRYEHVLNFRTTICLPALTTA